MAEKSIKMSKFHMKDESVPPGNQSTDIGREYRSSTCVVPHNFQTSFLDELEETEWEHEEEPEEGPEEEPEYEELKKQIETEESTRTTSRIPLHQKLILDEYVKSWSEKLLNMNVSQRNHAQKLITKVLIYGEENKLNASSTVVFSTEANNLEIYENGQRLKHHPKPEYVIFKCK